MDANLVARQTIFRAVQQGKDSLLSFSGTRFAAPPVRHELSVTEPHRHAPAVIFDFQHGEARFTGQVRHLQRTVPPLLDDPASMERAGDQRIPRT